MKVKIIAFITILLCFSFISPVSAGQGCCSWHGGESGACSSSGKEICNDGTESPTCTCSSFSTSDYGEDNYNSSDDGALFWAIFIFIIIVGAIIINIVAFFYNTFSGINTLNSNSDKKESKIHLEEKELINLDDESLETKKESPNELLVALIVLFAIALVIFSVTMYKDVEVQSVDNQTNFIDEIINDNMNDYLDDHPETTNTTIYVKDLYEQGYIEEEKYNKYEEVQNDYIEIEYSDLKEEWTWNYYEKTDS